MAPKRRTAQSVRDDPFQSLWREHLEETLSRQKGRLTDITRSEWQRASLASFKRRPIPQTPSNGTQRGREQARRGGQASAVTRRENAAKVRRAIDSLRQKNPRLSVREIVHRYLTRHDPAWDTKTLEQRRNELNAAVLRYRRAHARTKKTRPRKKV